MTSRNHRQGFAARPSDPDGWVRNADGERNATAQPSPNTARLTIDVTPTLRGRIKVVAFRRGLTAADMLRDLLEREFPPGSDDPGAAS